HTPLALHSFPTRRSSDLNCINEGAEFRIFVRHQFFSPTPYKQLIVANDHLGADAVPLVLSGPVFYIAQRVNFAFDCVCQIKWIGDRKSTRLNSSHVKISY